MKTQFHPCRFHTGLPAGRREPMMPGGRGAYARNSIAMARLRLEEAEEIGAEVVLTDCNSCVHNLANAKLRKQKFKIYNTTEFINLLMEKEENI